ncbi:MAG: PilZ domain-containing protein [Actinomycetota bacterium]
MSGMVTTGMRVEVHPRDLGGDPTIAMVFDVRQEITIRFRGGLPDWCGPNTEVVLTLADDSAQPIRWQSRVIRTEDDAQLAIVSAPGEGEAIERRRAARPTAPVPVEWSQPPDRTRHTGVGVDLSRLGIRFRTTAAAAARLDRIVLAVVLPSGALTCQGEVVGVRRDEVRVEFVALHPEALRRLVAWEAAVLSAELAPPG